MENFNNNFSKSSLKTLINKFNKDFNIWMNDHQEILKEDFNFLVKYYKNYNIYIKKDINLDLGYISYIIFNNNLKNEETPEYIPFITEFKEFILNEIDTEYILGEYNIIIPKSAYDFTEVLEYLKEINY